MENSTKTVNYAILRFWGILTARGPGSFMGLGHLWCLFGKAKFVLEVKDSQLGCCAKEVDKKPPRF